MCNASDQIASKVQDYIEIKAMMDELQLQLDALTDEIKAFMDENEADEMQSGSNLVTYKPVTSKRVDTTALKKLLGDALDPYFKVVTTKRFQVR